ncbi:histone H4 [Emericellopsis atlantica]|uniref:Histone H4 n=1 Tax=Emericellopsis atlantica TaxID=2614577 RepID=A0A9P7ZV68_9HYPO|nr:histone H4 [Emericellopsis atlantica]KAG9258949.1 histone H4 [Emericellopsis atlantica]
MPRTLPSEVGRGGPGSARHAVGGKTIQGRGVALPKRHRKIITGTINGITKPDIRRMARRGGVKRISGMIYEDVRGALKTYLEEVLHDCVAYVDHARRKTVTVTDVIHAVKRCGRPIYGFDPETNKSTKVRATRFT